MSDFQVNVVIGGVEQSVSTIKELENALRATREELKNVEVGGEAFEKLSEQARNLQREFKNSYKEATNFNQNLGQITESVSRLASSITAGFTIATSAMGLLGAEGEDLSKAQVKAQQAFALALSATTLASNAKRLSEDLSNITEALGLSLTKAKTNATVTNTVVTEANVVATEAQAAAIATETVVTEGAVVATAELNATMAANPLGLLLLALTAVIGALILFTDEEETAKSTVQETNAALLEQNASIKKQTQDYIALYKLKREVIIAAEKDDKKRIELQKELENDIFTLQSNGLKNQVDNLKKANIESIKEFQKYKAAYKGEVDETYEYINAKTGDFITKTRKVESNIGQARLDEIASNKLKREKLISDDNLNELDKLKESKDKGLLTESQYNDQVLTQKKINNIRIQQTQSDYYIAYLTAQEGFLKQSKQKDDKILAENLKAALETTKQSRAALDSFLTDLLTLQLNNNKRIIQENNKANDDASKKAIQNQKDLARELQKLKDENIVDEQQRAVAQLKTAYETTKKELIAKGAKNELLKQLDLKYYNDGADIENKFNDIKQKNIDDEKARAKKRAKDLLEINNILNSEISVGDNNVFDNLRTLELKKIQLQMDTIDSERSISKRFVDERISDLETIQKAETDLLLKQLDKRLISVEDYEIAVADVEAKYNNEREYLKGLDSKRLSFEDYQKERLALTKKYLNLERSIAEESAKSEELSGIATFTDNLEKQFGAGFSITKEGTDLINRFKENAEKDYQSKLESIRQDSDFKYIAESKKTEDTIIKYRLDNLIKLTQSVSNTLSQIKGEGNAFAIDLTNNLMSSIVAFNTLADTEFKTTEEKVAAYSAAIASTLSSFTAALSAENQMQADTSIREAQRATDETKNIYTTSFNEEVLALKAKLNQGLLDEQQYNSAVSNLRTKLNTDSNAADKKQRDYAYQQKKKAFEEEKKFRIAQTIIAGAQGAVAAFTSAMSLPYPANLIVGGITAAAIAGLTVKQVSNISKTQFESQAVEPVDISIPSTDTGSSQVNSASGGGMTQFDPKLVNSGGNQFGPGLNNGTDSNSQRVYVVESDITDAQRRVSIAESNATF